MTKYIRLGEKNIDLSSPVVMGIMNVTKDSFYDGGKYTNKDAIIKRMENIIDEGAEIIDLGAYSSRPGALDISMEEEVRALSYALEIIRKYHSDFPVSIDTFRASVAKEIYDKFGDIIVNDISGGNMDDNMFDFVASTNLPYILMHMQGVPQSMQNNPKYENVVDDVKGFFDRSICTLNSKGFDNIILDPGFGFGKNTEHNYELLGGLDKLICEYPMLIGISRKSMIYKPLAISPQEALNGTTFINTISLLKGGDILRVHDVKEAVEIVKLYSELKPFI